MFCRRAKWFNMAAYVKDDPKEIFENTSSELIFKKLLLPKNKKPISALKYTNLISKLDEEIKPKRVDANYEELPVIVDFPKRSDQPIIKEMLKKINEI